MGHLVPGYTCTITALGDALARAIIDIDELDLRVEANKERRKFLEWLAPIIDSAQDPEMSEDDLYHLLMGLPIVPLEAPPVPDGYMAWVKRCGPRHLMKCGLSPSDPGYGNTVCGKPLLGNNYAKARHTSELCPECHKS